MDGKNSLTLSQLRRNVYFCPYCKIVSANSDDFKPKKQYNQYKYTCFSETCGKTFTQSEYTRQSKNGKHYFTRVGEENVDDVIEEIVISFYKKGFSYREISSLTHFSRTRIEKIIKSRIKYKAYKRNVFFEEVLKIDSKYIRNSLADTCVKMLNFGFTQRQVINHFKLYHVLLKECISESTIKYENDVGDKHRVKIEGNTISYSYFD